MRKMDETDDKKPDASEKDCTRFHLISRGGGSELLFLFFFDFRFGFENDLFILGAFVFGLGDFLGLELRLRPAPRRPYGLTGITGASSPSR